MSRRRSQSVRSTVFRSPARRAGAQPTSRPPAAVTPRTALLTTALGTGVLAALAMAPAERAWAADECGAIPGGANSTVDCVGLVINEGVEYTPAAVDEVFTLNIGNGTIGGATVVTGVTQAGVGQVGIVIADVLTAGPVEIPIGGVDATSVLNIDQFSQVTGTSIGALVWTDGADNDATINNDGTVLSTGAGAFSFGHGLIAVTEGGVATVNNNEAGEVNAVENGLIAFSIDGNAVVTNAGEINTTNGAGMTTLDPIFGLAPTGGTATGTNTGTIDAGGSGMVIVSVGDATAENSGSITAGVVGMFVQSTDGAASATNSSSTSVDAQVAGIIVIADDDADIDNTGGSVTTAAGPGLFAQSQNGNVEILNLQDGGGLGGTVETLSGDGIAGDAVNGGNVVIDSETGTVNATNYGIFGQAVMDGTVMIDAGDTTSGLDSVRARTEDGNIVVNTYGTITSTTDDGVDAEATGDGAVTVNLSGATAITAGNGGGDAGVQAVTQGLGNVLITDNLDVGATVDSTDVGIDGVSFGTGNVTVEVDGTTVNADEIGVLGRAFGNGNVDLTSGAVTAGTGGVVGIASGTGNADVANEGVVTITGAGFAGLNAEANGGGDATTTVNDEVVIEAAASVFSAARSIATDGNATTTVDAPITVDGTATFGASAKASGAGNEALVEVNEKITEGDTGTIITGAAAVGVNGADATVISNADGEIDPPLIGMSAITFGAGTATVENNALVQADLIGLFAANFGGGDVVVNNNAAIGSDGIGISTVNIGDGITDINVDGLIRAVDGVSPTPGPGVTAFATTGTGEIDIDVGATGDILSTDSGISVTAPFHAGLVSVTTLDGASVVSEAESAVDIFTFSVLAGVENDVLVDNGGLLEGLGDVADTAVVDVFTDGAIEVNNAATGTITTTGGVHGNIAMDLDALNNDGDPFATVINNDGVIIGRVLLTFDDDQFNNNDGAEWFVEGFNGFGFSGGNELNNEGTIFANTQNDGATTTLFGLDTLDNTDGTISQQDGDETDTLITTGAYFAGPNSGTYLIDAFLNDGSLGGSASDLFVIGDFVEAGSVTLVGVNNVAPVPTGFDPVGTLIVDVNDGDGNAEAENFQLAGGPIPVGFFSYDIFFDDDADQNEFWLRNDVNELAFELPALITATQEVWHRSNQTWLDRTADLRIYTNPGVGTMDAAVNRAESGYTDGSPGIWVRGFGSWLERDRSVDVPGALGITDHDGGYDQDTYGAQAGIDFPLTKPNAEGGTFIIGALGGYVWSDIDFAGTNSTAELEGPQVGVYATYLNGGFFGDLLVKAEFLELDYDTDIGFDDDNASTDVFSIGAVADTGYRFDFDGFFIEPGATLAYVHTDIDDLEMLASEVEFDADDSLRGRLGARAGARFQPTSATVIEPFLHASVWHEFLADNEAAFSSALGMTSVSDDASDTWVEVGAGVNIVDFGSGISGFIKGDYQFAGDTDGFDVQGGVRLNF